MFENLTIIIVIALVVLAAVGYVYYKDRHPDDIDLPMPSELRKDLLYGYYSSITGQFEQTKDHINLFWYSHFMGFDEFVQIVKQFSGKIVVDLAPFLVSKKDGGDKLFVLDNADNELRNFFTKLRNEGILNRIDYLYPSDEPNLFVASEAEHKKMLDITKAVASEFSELSNAKLAVIYGRKAPFWNIGMFDVVGVDYYKQKSTILTTGEHARLIKEMKPGTKTFLVPGPAFGHLPDPWVAYAHTNKNEVEGIIPFLWFDHPDHKDVKYTGLQAADEAFRNKWVAAGKSIVNN